MRRWTVAAVLLVLILLFAAVPLTAAADMGPKPSVRVTFTGVGEESYYVTLLSQAKSTGPYHVYTGVGENTEMRENAADDAV